MSVVDHIENQVYRLIDMYQLSDDQSEQLFLKFANSLPTYTVTPKGEKIVDLVEEDDFKAGGGTI
jgi:zona occludens toxin (predicted ATPase)